MSPHRSIRRQRSGRQSDVLTTDKISTRVLAQEARESAELIAAQNRVLELVARGTPLHHTLDVLLQEIEAQTPGTLSSILLIDPDGVHVRHGAAPTLPASYVRAIDGEAIGPRAGSCGTAAYRGEPVIVEDITTDPLWDSYRSVALAHGLRACWSTPIFDGEHRVLGTFALYFRTPGRPTPRHYRVINGTTLLDYSRLDAETATETDVDLTSSARSRRERSSRGCRSPRRGRQRHRLRHGPSGTHLRLVQSAGIDRPVRRPPAPAWPSSGRSPSESAPASMRNRVPAGAPPSLSNCRTFGLRTGA